VSLPARSIPPGLLALLALAAPAQASELLELRGGELVPRDVPALPPAAGPEALLTAPGRACVEPPARLTQPKAPVHAAASVTGAIAAAERRGTIEATEARSYRRAYRQARRARGKLGRYRGELSAQISILNGIAARGRMSGGRMPALFLQLRRNTQFWSGDPKFPARPDIEREPCSPPPSGTSSGAGSRITFEGSKLVFQYYPGAGLQLQPLANFGMANGLISQCRREPEACDREGLRQLLAELIAIRSGRGGFITWEYWFHFGGGAPPWTSGMSQGTAIQALTRASEQSILNDKSYLHVAKTALGAFQKPPPTGVRVRSGRGSHYLLYSFDPRLRVLNGFLQAVTGLYDYARISGDKTARALYRDGDRAARAELRRYDLGTWSRYNEGGGEASGGYHSLVTSFLGNLCTRLKGRYCVYRDRFRRYASTPPSIVYTGRSSARRGRALAISYRTDKPTCAIAKVADASGRTVYRAQQKGSRGSRSFSWTPRRAGSYTLTLTGLDPLKNKKVVKRSIRVG
jgi:hypothetical protein